MTNYSKDPVVAEMQQQYEAIRERYVNHIKQVIGEECRKHDVTFGYLHTVYFRRYIDASEVDDDEMWTRDPEKRCYRFAYKWYVKHAPGQEIADLLGDYEDMFRNFAQSMCVKGDWTGI